MLRAEGVLKAALADIFDQARGRKLAALARLHIHASEAADGFKLLGAAGVVRAASTRASVTGEYETTAGSGVRIEFEGIAADAQPLREFLESQPYATAEKNFKVAFTLAFKDGLLASGEASTALAEQLSRYASGSVCVEATAEARP